MLGTLVGTFKGPDLRTALKSDIELLKSPPEENVELRAELQRTVDVRVYELVAFLDRNHELRQTAGSYRAIGATSFCSCARCCSPWSGGTSRTAGATG